MSTVAEIKPTNLKVWTNRHENFKQPIDNLFDVSNAVTNDLVQDYCATTTAIKGLIASAIANNKSLRVLGGGWSFTKIAATDGWIVNTKHLNLLFNISAFSIAPSYKGNREQLLFAQCGNSVQELSNYLRSVGKSLKTSGASNGQTIIGAISTGTHGSAYDFGATQDFIVSLHLIVSEDKDIWLERSSYPVVSDDFVQRFQTQIVRDDDLFNAVLVSFGSFGFIHGAMIETEPLYLLEGYRSRVPLSDNLKHVMETLDFSAADFTPHGTEHPFHFQSLVNQFDLDNGGYVTMLYKRPFSPDYTPPVSDPNKAGPGDDAPAFLGRFTDLLTGATPTIVNQLIKTAYAPYNNIKGTLSEFFCNTDTRGKVLSTAMGIPISYVNEVNDMLIELNNTNGNFPGVLSYRYVKKSQALLAFTRFEYTCVVELDGIESAGTHNFYDAAWKALDDNHIPYTFHWGKVNNLTGDKIMDMYQSDRDKWIRARSELLPDASFAVFNNQTLRDWGLDKKATQLRPF